MNVLIDDINPSIYIAMCLRVLRDALVSQAKGLWLEQTLPDRCSAKQSNDLVDGCYSSKFLRISACRFLLEMLVRGKRYEVACAGIWTSPLTIINDLDAKKEQ